MYQVTVDVPFRVQSDHMSVYDLMIQYAHYQQEHEYDFVGSAEDCIADLRNRIPNYHDHQETQTIH